MAVTKVILSLAAFAFIPQTETAEERFVFSSNFDCRYTDRELWYYSIRYFEKDLGTEDDIITATSFNSAPPGKSKMRISATHGGEESRSNAFEPYAIVRHTCTRRQREATVILKFDKQCNFERELEEKFIFKEICDYSFDVDLTNYWGVHKQSVQLIYHNVTAE